MLVLTRKKNEVIVIGEGADQIEVIVVEVRGDKVRLGVQARTGIPVHRKEVHDKIEAEGRCVK